MVSDKIHIITPRNPKPEDEKFFRPAIDLTYSDTEEGMKRARLTINLLTNHISNITQIRWQDIIDQDPEYYKNCSSDLLMYQITALIFTIYNELLSEIPDMMQNEINLLVQGTFLDPDEG